MYLTEDKKSRLLEITEKVDKGFLSQHQYYKRFIAVNAMKKNKEVDISRVKDLMKFIKQNTGLFSPFRNNSFILSTLLYLGSKKPEDTFIRIKKHYEILRSNGFKSSQYLPMTCYTLDSIMFDDKIQDMAIQTDSYRSELIERAKKVYEEMKKNHPWLTGGDDYPLALLIAHSHKDLAKIESIYERLNQNGLSKGNNLQSLSNITALTDVDEARTVDRVLSILSVCKGEGFKVSQTMYPGIGLLALVTEQEEHLHHVIEVTNELGKMKKYKWLDRNLLFMFAVDLVSEDIKKELSSKTISETTLNITIEQLVMAQTAVMIGAMAASSAVVSSAT